MTNQTSLPSLADFELAIQKLDVIWELVPRAARPIPVHKKLKDDLDRIFQRCGHYVRSRETQLTAVQALSGMAASQGANGESGPTAADLAAIADEPPLAIIMRIMRTLTPEQWLQVRVLMMTRDLTDDGRLEMFEELGATHHLACGAEIYPDEVHECDFDLPDDEPGADALAPQPVPAPATPPATAAPQPGVAPNNEVDRS